MLTSANLFLFLLSMNRTRMIQMGRKKSILPLKPDTNRDSQSLLLAGNANGQLYLFAL
ncbi:hypothetical protein BDF20DRAFT_901923 [Mycotypha africana]|uniref:uncharacterized protein n=1 Tax=Mycotypha africana TaxID=64632 RepID=UPI002300D11C|nr:uncharacterized protein BDF20DRAFT_901923 [Mycotypha africana]KAI8967142.1 hypothetical protein BDF20DRAFT_901923 [Mycotypha africana]